MRGPVAGADVVVEPAELGLDRLRVDLHWLATRDLNGNTQHVEVAPARLVAPVALLPEVPTREGPRRRIRLQSVLQLSVETGALWDLHAVVITLCAWAFIDILRL